MPADSISAWSVLQRPWILLEREQLGNARASQLNVILGFPGAFSGGRSLFVRTFLWIYWLVWLPHQGGSWVNLCKTPALCRCTAQGSLESGQVNAVHPLQPPCSVLLDLCAQNCSASCFPVVPDSADLFTYVLSFSEVTGSCHSLPI